MKITYIYHSCYTVELSDAVFIFDYYKGKLPEWDKAKKIYAFASHSHYDHYHPSLFECLAAYKNVTYVLSEDIKASQAGQDIWYVKPDMTYEIGDISIKTLKSTDEGVAFLVCYDGRIIYHAGDLNWWHWEGESESYNRIMGEDYKRAINELTGEKIDAAFVPLDGRLEKAYYLGMDYFMKRTETKLVFPMHFWGDYSLADRLKEDECSAVYRDRLISITAEYQVTETEDKQDDNSF